MRACTRSRASAAGAKSTRTRLRAPVKEVARGGGAQMWREVDGDACLGGGACEGGDEGGRPEVAPACNPCRDKPHPPPRRSSPADSPMKGWGRGGACEGGDESDASPAPTASSVSNPANSSMKGKAGPAT